MPAVIDWADFDWFVQQYLRQQTIPILKAFVEIFERHTKLWVGYRSGERKEILVEKLKRSFEGLKTRGDFAMYKRTREEIEQAGRPAYGQQQPTYTAPAPAPTFGGRPVPPPNTTSSGFHAPSPAPLPSGSRATPTAPRYNASSYAPGPSRTTSGWGPASGSSSSNLYTSRPSPAHTLHDWKSSPMWKPVKAITSMEPLPDIAATESSHTRKEKRVTFVLPADVAEKLQACKLNFHLRPRYSLRIFCTSGEHYRPSSYAGYGGVQIQNNNIPIEYPTNPDVFLDNTVLPFKERGLRGKAGSAPPFDLNKSGTMAFNNAGRLYSVTFGHTGPTPSKKKEISKRFWYQIVLTEITTKDDLLVRLALLQPTSAETILKEARQRAEDDDIVIGASNMTLKDPLAYTRIVRPIRSTKCTHSQCFEATWWLEGNSQHPQFLCPLCNKPLNFDDLILDGFFQSILAAVPESVDEVVLEADYEWHTEDGKYGSVQWMKENGTNGSVAPGGSATPRLPTPVSDPKPEDESPENKAKRKAIEILSDSDEEDADVPLAKVAAPTPNWTSHANGHASSVPPRASATRTPSVPPQTGVIDLTLDSDDEDDDTDDEQPARPSQTAYFHQPGVGNTGQGAADSSHRPPSLPPLPPRNGERESDTRLQPPYTRPQARQVTPDYRSYRDRPPSDGGSSRRGEIPRLEDLLDTGAWAPGEAGSRGGEKTVARGAGGGSGVFNPLESLSPPQADASSPARPGHLDIVKKWPLFHSSADWHFGDQVRGIRASSHALPQDTQANVFLSGPLQPYRVDSLTFDGNTRRASAILTPPPDLTDPFGLEAAAPLLPLRTTHTTAPQGFAFPTFSNAGFSSHPPANSFAWNRAAPPFLPPSGSAQPSFEVGTTTPTTSHRHFPWNPPGHWASGATSPDVTSHAILAATPRSGSSEGQVSRRLGAFRSSPFVPSSPLRGLTPRASAETMASVNSP